MNAVLVFVTFLSLLHSVFGGDLEEMKREAVAKIDSLMKSAERGYFNSWADFKAKHEMIQKTGKNRLKYGEFILNGTSSEIDHIVGVALDKADIWSSSNDTRRCIVTRGQKAQNEVRGVYAVQFLPVVEEMMEKTEFACNQHLLKWLQEGKAVWEPYFAAHNQSKTDIEKATTEAQVKKSLSEFEILTGNILRVIERLVPAVTATLIQYESAIEGSLKAWKTAARHRLDTTGADISDCFPAVTRFLL